MVGSLSVVGVGIDPRRHMTLEVQHEIVAAEKLFVLVPDLSAEEWLGTLNESIESLASCYRQDEPRYVAYERMVSVALASAKAGRRTCVAYYGHPGILCFPGHETVRRARLEGITARMLPGISAEACLFADLELDPGVSGCESFEATDFLMTRPVIDRGALVVLWQVGALAQTNFGLAASADALSVLVQRLSHVYGPLHSVILYEAAQSPFSEPRCATCMVSDLGPGSLSGMTTVVIPPRTKRRRNRLLMRVLGLRPLRTNEQVAADFAGLQQATALARGEQR